MNNDTNIQAEVSLLNNIEIQAQISPSTQNLQVEMPFSGIIYAYSPTAKIELLPKGIQELSGKVNGHDDRIAALEKENEELRKEIEELKKEMLTFDAKISYLLDKTR